MGRVIISVLFIASYLLIYDLEVKILSQTLPTMLRPIFTSEQFINFLAKGIPTLLVKRTGNREHLPNFIFILRGN
jgi:hypothetical protein